MLPPIQAYSDQAMILTVGFIVPIITSTLWTFGFIIMVNQRLNIENCVEKEKMQQVFNTSPDAALITRLNDGFLIDVNVGFSIRTGYTPAEVIGNSTLKINLWHNIEDREIFLTELNEKGICENMEFVFMRKDGSCFVGMISARLSTLYDSYGHLAWDDCLRQIGTSLKTIVLRIPDIVARYGGEVFVVILPETEIDGVKALAERIREAIEELAIPHTGSETAEIVTVSLGVVSVYPNRLALPEQVVALADEDALI